MTRLHRHPTPSKRRRLGGQNGHAILEFSVFLPFFLLVFVGMIDISLLLSRQINLSHLSRESASFVARGAEVDEAINAITSVDGVLGLDGPNGRIIITRISRQPGEGPLVVSQRTVGGLDRGSIIGTLGNQETTPASIPNGMELREGASMAVVELYSQQDLFGGGGLTQTLPRLILSSVGAF